MDKAPGFKQVLKAVLGAIVGVQSEQQRQQDFQTTTIWPYLVAGILAVVAFIVLLLLLVSWVVPG
jgi:branched-subunit amino acid transport protein